MKNSPRRLAWMVVAIAVIYLGATTIRHGDSDDTFHLQEFATLPIQESGRIQPFDTFARVQLMHVSHRMSFTHQIFKADPTDPEKEIVDDKIDSVDVSATQWALETMLTKFSQEKPSLNYRVFRIDNDDVVDSLHLKRRPGWRYSLSEIASSDELWDNVKRMAKTGPRPDDVFDNKIGELFGKYKSFERVANMEVRIIPPTGSRKQSSDVDWLAIPDAVEEYKQGGENEATALYMQMFHAYVTNKPQEFNQTLEKYQQHLERTRPREYHAVRLEAFFNRFEPFYQCSVLYGCVFVLGVLSWLVAGWSKPLQTAAFALALLTLAVHTWALITRIYLTGRPPVTNLYSSAVFIGWGCVMLCLFLEWIYKSGIGLVVAAITGMITLIVAHNLVTGDTMEMLQAVLDTNFWLATHVICITCGYTASFVAGFLGILYVVLGVFTPRLRGEASVNHAKMIYGVVCFATMLSFVGTVLGGIWADESWGRFWGWDPKENGALLIVVWSALVLHARWGGLVKARGMANLAIFGNCVTAWSWFGTNLLGVGLHSYGFMKGAMLWLLVFVFTQLIIIGIGCLPLRDWKSFVPPRPPAPPQTPPGKASVVFSA